MQAARPGDLRGSSGTMQMQSGDARDETRLSQRVSKMMGSAVRCKMRSA